MDHGVPCSGTGKIRNMLKPAPPPRPGRIWTLPNLISVSRLVIFLPVTTYFLLQEQYVAGLVGLVVLGITDWLDGFLARRLDLVTEFGKNLDPLADRLAIVVVGIALMIDGLLPWPYIVAILGTDLTLGILGLAWFGGPPKDLEVSVLGKARTAMILVSMPLLILSAATGWHWVGVVGLVSLAIATAGHVIAGFGYWKEMYRMHTQNLHVAADMVD